MQKINFEDATLVTQAKVTVGGTDYEVIPATYSGGTDLDANTLNDLQDKVEASFKNSYSESTSDGYACDYSNDHFEPKGVVLYNDSTGTTGNITLSDNPNNYSKFDFIGIDTDTNSVQKMFNGFITNGYLVLNSCGASSGSWSISTRAYAISSNTLTFSSHYYTLSGGTPFNYNNFKVRKVIGYK